MRIYRVFELSRGMNGESKGQLGEPAGEPLEAVDVGFHQKPIGSLLNAITAVFAGIK